METQLKNLRVAPCGSFLHPCNQICLLSLSAHFRQHVEHLLSGVCVATPQAQHGSQQRKAPLPSKHCLEKRRAEGRRQCWGRTETQQCPEIPRKNAKGEMIPDGCGDSMVALTKYRGRAELGLQSWAWSGLRCSAAQPREHHDSQCRQGTMGQLPSL